MAKITFTTICVFMVAAQSFAMSIVTSAGYGVMTQPASQYFHYTYNVSSTLYLYEDTLSIRAYIWQRPLFDTTHFQDQDTGEHLMAGYRFQSYKQIFCNLYFGVGEIHGWVQRKIDQSKTSFQVFGSTSTIQVQYKFENFTASIEHLLFIGRRSQLELDAKVLWPFSVTSIQLGYEI
ncbi:MAG: hypothetical protein AB8C84_08120 [Oligoflexales bacterium]